MNKEYFKKLQNLSKEELIEEIRSLINRDSFGLIYEKQIDNEIERLKDEVPYIVENEDLTVVKSEDLNYGSIIEGDNYHSLKILSQYFKNKVDVIYIDPPYNTGANNWVYNNDFVDDEDSFRHSKWLSFMENRLRIAKTLLKNDGSLICAIDENEHANLVCLLQKLFKSHEIHSIAIVHNPGGIRGKNFSYCHEYAVFVIPKTSHGEKITAMSPKTLQEDPEYLSCPECEHVFLTTEDKFEIDASPLRNWGGESRREDGRNTFYPVIVDLETLEIIGFGDVLDLDLHPEKNEIIDGKIYIYPIDKEGIERKWRYQRSSVEKIKDDLQVKIKNDIYDIEFAKKTAIHKTVWNEKKYDASTYGTKLLKSIINSKFDFPKSLWTVHDCIEPLVRNNKNALVLDFFAGSGTTGHALMEINKKDNGERNFILCTNNENFNESLSYGVALDACYERNKQIIIRDDIEFNKKNISGYLHNLRYYKIEFLEKKLNDGFYRNYAEKIIPLIKLRHSAFVKQQKTNQLQVYEGNDNLLIFIFDDDEKKLKLEKYKDVKKKKIIYIFSYGSDNSFPEEYLSDFADTIYTFPLANLKQMMNF